ncbi:MAG: efflux RND transporter permease subunit [Roseovarius confluentis]
MTGIVDWAASRARMVIAFIVLSILAGGFAYVGLPKEGEPDIEIPALFVSVPFPGISAEDSETLLIKPMETELSDLDGLKTMSGTAAEGYAGIAMEFEFGWDKTKIMADVRDAMNSAQAKFPAGAEQYSINEINFSEFPIVIVNLTGALPERTLLRVAKDLQDRLEGLEPVLEAALTGHRDEMVEVVIDPLRLEAYNVTAGELINVVVNNNQLIAAGEIETETGAFAVKIPSSFKDQRDIYNLPVKTDGDKVITLADIADIRLTFEDRAGTARFNGETTVALQVVKRKGFNIIDTAALVRSEIEAEKASWSPDLREAIRVGTSNDQSGNVASMVSQLEGSVLTAIALVMIVVLAALGARSALLVGFAIPTSFLMTFALFAVMDVTISNIVMFGLILAVGMLVDGAVVVVEYADRRISEGAGPMSAYTEAAKRMFWPIAASTATTLCAFLPMLFWPGVAGEFMGLLPVTMIFVLIASFIVAILFLPVMGGVAGRMTRALGRVSAALSRSLPWLVRAALVPVVLFVLFVAAMQTINPAYLLGPGAGMAGSIFGAVLFAAAATATSIVFSSVKIQRRQKRINAGSRRTPFGYVIAAIVNNPVMPLVTIGAVLFFVVSTFSYFGENNNGVEFFVESEPEQAIVYVRARGNLSLSEKDSLVRQVEDVVLEVPGIESVFAFAGAGGLNANTGGASGPNDTIGQVQIELVAWEDRPAFARANDYPLEQLDGDVVLENLEARLARIPGIRFEILNLSRGPASPKPVHLRLKSDNWEDLLSATAATRAKFEETAGLIDVEDTLPLPGIDWQINVDVEKAGRYGADVRTVGGMVQLVTRGLLLDTMRVDSSDEEIEIRVRLPESDRVLSTLDTLKVRTTDGLVPLSNFITREPVAQLAQINRVDQKRYFDVKAGVAANLVKIETDSLVTMATARALPEGTEAGNPARVAEDPSGKRYEILTADQGASPEEVANGVASGTFRAVPLTANERIATLTEWLETEKPLPAGMDWEWTGDQEDQAESQAFLQVGFTAALGLMFIILLAQFNSVYNAVLVLLAVVLSTTGVLIGMLVMDQPFSIIMTGTGIVALAGIVVNNNIVLIDTYQEYSQYMSRLEAIVRTAEARIRPVLLTTITTMAGLTPMMFGLSLDFIGGGYSLDSPTALWWKQLATAVVFGLGIATVLTLVVTPSMLALRIWFWTIIGGIASTISAFTRGSGSRNARDYALKKAAKRARPSDIVWDVDENPSAPKQAVAAELRAAE